MGKTNIAIAVDTEDAGNAIRHAAQDQGLEIVFEQSPGSDAHAFVEQMGRLRPEMVFVEIPRMWGSPPRVIESLRAAPGTPTVVVIHANPDPEAILGAMRAGAAEFIYPPFDATTGKSLKRLLQDPNGSHSEPAGKTLGFLSVKGGCGATTIACHIAAELRRSYEKSVLLADFDPDLGIIAFLLKAASQYSVVDALQNAERLDHSMWQAFAASGPSGISVLNAPEKPFLPEMDPRQSGKFFHFVRSEYDFTVVDLGRGVTRFNLGAMSDIDETCLVTTLEIPALHRARQTIRTLLNGGCAAERLRLIVNFMPRHPEVSVSELETMIEFPIFATIPQDAEGISDAYSQNGLVSPGTLLGEQIAAVASRLTGQPEKEHRKFRLFARA